MLGSKFLQGTMRRTHLASVLSLVAARWKLPSDSPIHLQLRYVAARGPGVKDAGYSGTEGAFGKTRSMDVSHIWSYHTFISKSRQQKRQDSRCHGHGTLRAGNLRIAEMSPICLAGSYLEHVIIMSNVSNSSTFHRL